MKLTIIYTRNKTPLLFHRGNGSSVRFL